MALDTMYKRMSAAGAGRPYIRSVGPKATPDIIWRASGGIAYGGNLAESSEIGPDVSGIELRVADTRLHYMVRED